MDEKQKRKGKSNHALHLLYRATTWLKLIMRWTKGQIHGFLDGDGWKGWLLLLKKLRQSGSCGRIVADH